MTTKDMMSWPWNAVTITAVIVILSMSNLAMVDGGHRRRPCSTDAARNLSDSVIISSSTSSCEWSLDVDTSGQIILVRIERVKGSDATLTLIMDGNVTKLSSADDLMEDCQDNDSNCGLQLSGRSAQLLWMNDGTIINNTAPELDASFRVRYAIFESDVCRVVGGDLENVVIEGATPGSSVAVGSKIMYSCVGKPSTSAVHSECILKFAAQPSPSWSRLPPVCDRHHDCALLLEPPIELATNGSQILAYDGSGECQWEVEAKDEGALVIVHLERFDMDGSTSLELYDGERSDARLLKQFRGQSITGGPSTTFVSLHGKIVIALNDTRRGKNHWYARFSSQMSQCQPSAPIAPTNGDTRGSEISPDLSTVVAVFTCNDGYKLMGTERAECGSNFGTWNIAVPPICQPQELDVVSGSDKTMARTPQQQPRQNKLSRLHPQSTEEKGYKKISVGKDVADVAVKTQASEDVIPTVTVSTIASPVAEEEEPQEEDAQFSGEPDINWRIGSGEPDYESGGYSDPDNGYSEIEYFENGREKEEKERGGNDGTASNLPVMAIVLAITLPLLVSSVILISCIVYRKLYPVRMGPGRRFETFENPIYGRPAKRGSTMPSGAGASGQSAALASPARLAQNPAELERLTDVNVST